MNLSNAISILTVKMIWFLQESVWMNVSSRLYVVDVYVQCITSSGNKCNLLIKLGRNKFFGPALYTAFSKIWKETMKKKNLNHIKHLFLFKRVTYFPCFKEILKYYFQNQLMKAIQSDRKLNPMVDFVYVFSVPIKIGWL